MAYASDCKPEYTGSIPVTYSKQRFVRLEAQDTALSRQVHRFESGTKHQVFCSIHLVA